MRKYKFQLFDKDALVMREVLEIDFEYNYAMCKDGTDKFHYDLNTYSMRQWTGLKDKNGKEGFESDIVGLEDTLGEQFYGVIKWIGDKKAMYVIEMSGSHYPMSLLSDCEIVGDIYSNPELLEVTP